MAAQGGFGEDFLGKVPGALVYVVLSGLDPAGEVRDIKPKETSVPDLTARSLR